MLSEEEAAGIEEVIEAASQGAQTRGDVDAADRLASLKQAVRRASVRPDLALLISFMSPRQLSVFDGLARGIPSKQIADQLGIQIKTVDSHRSKIVRRLRDSGVRNNAGLAILAILSGRIPVQSFELGEPDDRPEAARGALPHGRLGERNFEASEPILRYGQPEAIEPSDSFGSIAIVRR